MNRAVQAYAWHKQDNFQTAVLKKQNFNSVLNGYKRLVQTCNQWRKTMKLLLTTHSGIFSVRSLKLFLDQSTLLLLLIPVTEAQ